MNTLQRIVIVGLMVVTIVPISVLRADLDVVDREQVVVVDKDGREVPKVRAFAWEKMAEAQVMIDPTSISRKEGEPIPEATGTPQDAIVMLMQFLEEEDLNVYETAHVWNLLGFAHYRMGDQPGTIRSYEQVLKHSPIKKALELQSLRGLYQLHFGEEDYEKAIEYMERYEALFGEPDPVVVFFRALGYYLSGDMPNSLVHALRVEEVANGQKVEMKEPWWYLQAVVYNELEDWENTIRVLETLTAHYPREEYQRSINALSTGDEAGFPELKLSDKGTTSF